MGVPKAVRHSRLLAIPLAERCRATSPIVSTDEDPCRALFGDGWDWHSCDLDPDGTHIAHHCPCGSRWTVPPTTPKTRRTR